MQEAQKAALSVSEAATFTGFSKFYLYKLIHQKKIPHYKPMGGRVFFRPVELEAWLFKNPQGASAEVSK